MIEYNGGLIYNKSNPFFAIVVTGGNLHETTFVYNYICCLRLADCGNSKANEERKNMKVAKTILATLLMATGGISLLAQDGPPPEEGNSIYGGRGGRRGGPMAMFTIEKFKEDLKLTEEQATKLTPLLDQIKELFKNLRKEMMENHDKGGDRESMKAKFEEMQTKIQKIFEPAKEFLSNEQYKQLTEKLTRHPGPPPKRDNDEEGERGPGEGSPEGGGSGEDIQ